MSKFRKREKRNAALTSFCPTLFYVAVFLMAVTTMKEVTYARITPAATESKAEGPSLCSVVFVGRHW